jgi:hypothetical protein
MNLNIDPQIPIEWKKKLCSRAINQHICSVSQFFKLDSLSSLQFFKIRMVSHKKVGPTLKSMRQIQTH